MLQIMQKQASGDAIANLIASTDGTVDIQLWCSELEAYQNVMKELTDKFKEQYSDVDFNITIGAVSEADAKDKILEDIDAAADVFVFADDQVNDLVNAGALQEVAATYTYDPKETNSEATVAAATKDGKLYAYPLTASNGYFLYYDSNIFSEEDVAFLGKPYSKSGRSRNKSWHECSRWMVSVWIFLWCRL